MIVSTLTWDKVTVRYKENTRDGYIAKRNDDVYKRATVFFNAEDKALKIIQPGNSDSEKHLLLARAELISISPWEMKWKAFYWSADFESTGFKELIEGEVTCEF